jgi:hypothetical protein
MSVHFIILHQIYNQSFKRNLILETEIVSMYIILFSSSPLNEHESDIFIIIKYDKHCSSHT